MEKQNLIDEINRLKKEKNAVIMAHYYQTADIQDIADVVGDSLALAQWAAKTDADVIVLCGVHFMGETAKILSPDKKVLIPDADAGCSLADRSFEPELLATPIVSAPRMRASVIAATVNGVLPLAARPMTTSLGPTVRPAMPATALGPESSAFSTARSNAASPPAIRKAT